MLPTITRRHPSTIVHTRRRRPEHSSGGVTTARGPTAWTGLPEVSRVSLVGRECDSTQCVLSSLVVLTRALCITVGRDLALEFAANALFEQWLSAWHRPLVNPPFVTVDRGDEQCDRRPAGLCRDAVARGLAPLCPSSLIAGYKNPCGCAPCRWSPRSSPPFLPSILSALPCSPLYTLFCLPAVVRARAAV